MPILLSHNSALERLRSVPPQVDHARRTQVPVRLTEVDPVGRDLAKIDPSQLGIFQMSVHHMVSARERRAKRDGFKSHLCLLESLPAGLLYDLGDGCYTAGPELTFVQMAQQTSLVGAVVLGYELCGTYSHFSRFISGFYDRRALTTTLAIGNAIDRLNGLRGCGVARKALKWVRDGSASPMETVVSCMLHLPTHMGGFGLVAPSLNYKIPNDDVARKLMGTKDCRIDNAYVEAMCGMEFDGKEYHRDREKERLRREALAHLGWTIYVLDVDDLTSYDAIETKVALLDKVGRQPGGPPSPELGKALLERLLRATRFGVGMNAALFGVDVQKGKVRVHI